MPRLSAHKVARRPRPLAAAVMKRRMSPFLKHRKSCWNSVAIQLQIGDVQMSDLPVSNTVVFGETKWDEKLRGWRWISIGHLRRHGMGSLTRTTGYPALRPFDDVSRLHAHFES